MARSIVLHIEVTWPEDPLEWEVHCYRMACAIAQQVAEAYVRYLDDRLLREAKPAGWQVVGKRVRTVVTRFGEVRIERRLYRDEEGESHFLLDEHLGLEPRAVATAEVQEAAVRLAAEVGFAQSAALLAQVTAGVLSTMTVWRIVQRVGRRMCETEAEQARAAYERGEVPPPGQRSVERLYVEADGIWVRLQREREKHMELKVGVAYEGWERLPDRREGYRLVGKRMYVHGHEACDFWEGASLAWFTRWDVRCLQEVILGGDGAGWIEKGREVLSQVIRQVDGFHLKRACRRALGREMGERLYEAIRAGRWAEAEDIWATAPRREGQRAQEAARWLAGLLARQEGVDWRVQVNQAPADARGLGTMEGNLAHLIADRMKGKGRSWSRAGAIHMAKVREQIVNGTLSHWWQKPRVRVTPAAHRTHISRQRKQRHDGAWLQARIPALHGSYVRNPSRLWLEQALRYRLN